MFEILFVVLGTFAYRFPSAFSLIRILSAASLKFESASVMLQRRNSGASLVSEPQTIDLTLDAKSAPHSSTHSRRTSWRRECFQNRKARELLEKPVLHEVPMPEENRKSMSDSLWKRIEGLLEEIRARAETKLAQGLSPQSLIGRWWSV
jgi:hypothetical protein